MDKSGDKERTAGQITEDAHEWVKEKYGKDTTEPVVTTTPLYGPTQPITLQEPEGKPEVLAYKVNILFEVNKDGQSEN